MLTPRFLQRVLLVFCCLATPVTLAAPAVPRPRAMHELGFLYAQSAFFFEEGVEMLFFREELFREAHSEFARWPSEDLRRLVRKNYGVLTAIQRRWQDKVMDARHLSKKTRLVWHPKSYIRAQLSPPIDDDLLEGMGAVMRDVEPVDAKGNGYSPQGEREAQPYHLLAETILRETGPPPAFETLQIVRGVAQSLLVQADDSDAHLAAEALKSEQFRAGAHLQHLRTDNHWKRTLAEAALLGFEQIEQNGLAAPATVDRFLNALRRLDYRNGLLAAKRVVKEAYFEEAAVLVVQTLNEEWGTHLRINRNYFGLLLPVDILVGGGRQNPLREPAGVIGREAGWRYESGGRRNPQFPAELFSSLLRNTDQFTVDGALIDLETMQLHGPGISKALAYVPTQELEEWAAAAVRAFVAGDKDAVERGFAKARGAIDVDALRAWARENKPAALPVDAQLFANAEALARTIAESEKPNRDDEVAVLKTIRTFYKAGRDGEANALLSIVAVRSVFIIDALWNETRQANTRAIRKAEQAEARKAANDRPAPATIDVSILVNVPTTVLSSQLIHFSAPPDILAWRRRRLRELIRWNGEIALQILTPVAAETFRAVFEDTGTPLLHLNAGSAEYNRLGRTIGVLVWLEDQPLEKITDASVQAIRNYFGGDVLLFEGAVVAAGRLLGTKQLSSRVIQRVFPEVAPLFEPKERKAPPSCSELLANDPALGAALVRHLNRFLDNLPPVSGSGPATE